MDRHQRGEAARHRAVGHIRGPDLVRAEQEPRAPATGTVSDVLFRRIIAGCRGSLAGEWLSIQNTINRIRRWTRFRLRPSRGYEYVDFRTSA